MRRGRPRGLMTRSSFLAMIASAPLGRLAAQVAGDDPGLSRPLVVSHPSLIGLSGLYYLSGSAREGETICAVDLENALSVPLTTGNFPAWAVSHDGRTLYVSYGPGEQGRGPGEQSRDHLAYLEIVDLTGENPTRGFLYPGPVGRKLRRIALSVYDDTVFTLTDTGDSRGLLIYTFDVRQGTFRPQPETGPMLEDPTEAFPLSESSGGRSAAVYDANRRVFWRSFLGKWNESGTDSRCPFGDDCRMSRHNETQAVRHPWSPNIALVHADGQVLFPDQYRSAWIDGIPPTRVLFPVSFTTNGDLFVPTGTKPDQFVGVNGFQGIDRLSIYRGPSAGHFVFTKTREIFLETPLQEVHPSPDGSVLYAVVDRDTIDVLDTASLTRLKRTTIKNGAIRSFQFVP